MDHVPARELVNVHGARVRLPDPERLVHLQFRRFAGCPVCNLHLRSFVARHAEVEAAGIREIVLFHTNVTDLRPHVADLPFDVVADPAKSLYREFGVESAPKSLLHPKAWPWIVRAIAAGLPDVVRRRKPLPPPRPEGGRLGLPADFVIAPDGRVLASHHGTHVYDQWSVDELLTVRLPEIKSVGCVPASGADAGVDSGWVPSRSPEVTTDQAQTFAQRSTDRP